MAVGPGGTHLYVTVGRVAAIFRLDLASGAIETYREFEPGRYPRDLSIAGQKMAYVVGGYVRAFGVVAPGGLPPLRSPFVDRGGFIEMIDLASGDSRRIRVVDRIHRRPVISPSGTQLVAEQFIAEWQPPLVEGGDPGLPVIAEFGDLHLFTIP